MGAAADFDGARRLPVLGPWRRARRGRAALQLALLVLPVALAVALASRTVRALQHADAGAVLAALTLVALAAGGPLLAVLDARRLARPADAVPSGWDTLLRRLQRNRLACAGAGLIVLLALAGFLAPLVAPHDPLAFGAAGTRAFEPPGAAHWLGTDQFGRDVLSRLLYGARVSLGIGFATALLAIAIGTGVGLVAGYAGGRVDDVLMRGVDLLIAFPRLFLLLLVIGLLRPSIALVVAVLALTGWMATARLVRAQVQALRGATWVQAAQALGLPARRVVWRHVLPNVSAPILVSATLMVGHTVLAESALSFLGLGVQVPTPSWGLMIDEGRRVFPRVWWVSAFPGLAITLTVVGYNLLGDALRDALDPRLRI